MKARKVVNILAYVAVVLVAGSLVLGFLSTRVFDWGLVVKTWCDRIAFYLLLIVTVSCAFMYANSKRNRGYMVALIIFLAIIVVFMVL